MSSDVTTTRKFRSTIPAEHRVTLDTMIAWLWEQRFGTVQTIWLNSSDNSDDKLACTIILQAIVAADLNNIALVFKRLEGGAQTDELTLDGVLTI